jgi:acetyltransferase-like isoleucine patch superfamily enzyme
LADSSKQSNFGRDFEVGAGAYIEAGAKIGKNVEIKPFAVVLSGAVIEDDCIIGDHCVIGHPTKLQVQKADFSSSSPKVASFMVQEPVTRIGEGSIIRSGSTVYRHVKIGRRLRTGHNVLIREHVGIGDDCVAGSQAVLDGYIKIGNRSMVQSQCYVAQSVTIGKGVFIAPGCIFLDNKKIILGKGLAGIAIEDYARIGGGSKILPGITIGKHALIGAGSVITNDIPARAVAYGVPAEVKRVQSEAEINEYMATIAEWE